MHAHTLPSLPDLAALLGPPLSMCAGLQLLLNLHLPRLQTLRMTEAPQHERAAPLSLRSSIAAVARARAPIGSPAAATCCCLWRAAARVLQCPPHSLLEGFRRLRTCLAGLSGRECRAPQGEAGT